MINNSVLVSTKKALNVAADDPSFDQEVMMFINGVFSTLNQLGIGPINGFEIEDEEGQWDAFLDSDARFNMVKTFMYLNVRLLFDPPAVASVAAAMQSTIDQLAWRINVAYENDARPLGTPNPPSTPSTPPISSGEIVIDNVTFTNVTFSGGVISGGTP